MTDLLRDTPLNAEQVDMAETLAGSSRVLLGLVEDVLDFSKIEAGKLTLEDTDFDLHALVNSAAKILLSQALDKGLELIVSIMPDVAPALRGDPHHLRQVLLNLIGNAIKFTQKGSITVHVSLVAETPLGPRLKFTVRDTGIGIPEEAQQRIFDSFAQADETTTRRFGGTGLGTTIARQLVDLMGGRMGLESSVGLGSTFWFEITLGRQAAAATGAEGQLGEAALLVIGFPPSERMVLQEALKSWDARPRFFDLVEQAVEQVVRDIAIAPPPRAALIHASRASLAQSMLEELRRGSQLPDLPAVIALPEAARPEALHGVPGGRNVVLGLPLDRRLLFNALHAVTAAEEDRQDVVFLSDYLKRRENSSIYRILVADDNASNRTVIGKILERAGHAVHMVESGEGVLDAIEETAFDIVVLDRNMPDMGGIEALKRLRFLERGRARTPVIVLSADVTSDARDESLAAGADAFLSKPIEAPRLLDLIAELGARADDTKPLPPVATAGTAATAWAAPPASPRRPTLVAADASPVLNRETLKLLEELGSDSGQHREFMERLIAAFVKDVEQVLRSLEAEAAPSGGELRAAIHALKGSVSSVGADRLTAYCNRVSGMNDPALRSEARNIARTLRDEFLAVREALAEYLAAVKRSAR
jgi:two-component system sensor histidine kinase RpfC